MSAHERTVMVSLCFSACQIVGRRTAFLKESVVSGADLSCNTAQLPAATVGCGGGGRRTRSYVVIATRSLLAGP